MSEYGVSLTDGPFDYNNVKHVGWQELGVTNPYTLLFAQQNVNNLSKAITTYLWTLKNTGYRYSRPRDSRDNYQCMEC